MTNVAVRLWADERGSSLVEFALLVMLLFVFVFGSLYAGMLGFSNTSLHAAVEAASRCRAIGITCTDAASTQTYAAGHFFNLSNSTPTFVSDTPSIGTDANCGNRVTGTLNYRFTWLLSSQTLPLSAKACFAS